MVEQGPVRSPAVTRLGDGAALAQATPVDSVAHSTAAAPKAVQDLLKWTETVAAPIGTIGGLLLFFGWTYSRAYFGYFGIDQRLLQYSVQDHLLLSADVMFGTAVMVLTVVLALVLLNRIMTPLRERRDRLG